MAGNLTSAPQSVFEYDAENRQISFDRDLATPTVKDATYVYDGDGRRVKKIADGVKTVFVYDIAGKLIAEYATNGSSGGGTTYVTSDMLGTPRVITGSNINNTSGGVKARHDYLAFGEELGTGVGGRTTGQGYFGDNVRQKWVGYERDTETGLDFAQARYYANTQGRFTSVDPMLSSGKPSEPQSWNRYSYVLNNPLLYTDPSGLIWGSKEIEENGRKFRRFQWFEGDTVGEGFTPYTSSHFVGSDQVLWLSSNSSDYLSISKEWFTEEEFSSLRSAQGANSTSFSEEQLNIVNRGIADTVRTGPQGARMKAVAGAAGSLFGGIGSSLSNFTFGAASREASRLPPVLFHYADDATAPLINAPGGQIGAPGALEIFFTNNGSYSPAMARELLALPSSNSGRALFAVDSQVLSRSSFLRNQFVAPANNRLGGGFEFVFSQPARTGFKQIR